MPRARLQREAKRRVTGADESRNAIRHPGMWRLFGLSRAAQPGIKQRVMNGASEEALAPMSGAEPAANVSSRSPMSSSAATYRPTMNVATEEALAPMRGAEPMQLVPVQPLQPSPLHSPPARV